MKSRLTLCFAGLVMAFMPGCCVFDALFGCGHFQLPSCGASTCDDGCGHSKKCDKKCRKCRECLQEHGGMAGGEFYPGMGYGDIYGGGGGGDCGCGGGGMAADYPGGGCAGCGGGGGFDGGAVMTTPMMTIPTPGPTPMPHGGTALPPPIPPAETSSVPQVPAGMQQVSVAEFQRLPGVIVSGPGSQAAQTAQVAAIQPASSVPSMIAAPADAKPLDATVISSVPANTRQIQQAGWAPVRR